MERDWRLDDWQPWFAWHPVKVGGRWGRWVWWRKVQRRDLLSDGYEYKL